MAMMKVKIVLEGAHFRALTAPLAIPVGVPFFFRSPVRSTLTPATKWRNKGQKAAGNRSHTFGGAQISLYSSASN